MHCSLQNVFQHDLLKKRSMTKLTEYKSLRNGVRLAPFLCPWRSPGLWYDFVDIIR